MSSVKEVILYHANWCGHCKKFLPIWEELKQNFKNIKFTDFEESKDEKIMEEENITGYPTIKIDGKVYEGSRDYDSLAAIMEGKTPQKNMSGPNQCGGACSISYRKKNIKDEDEYYKIKYLKYKAKYMQKRDELGI